MGAVKTNHKRNAQKRWVDREIKKWDRDCQDEEQQYNRGMRKRHDAHKLKRIYPNSIAPERLVKELLNQTKLFIDVWRKNT